LCRGSSSRICFGREGQAHEPVVRRRDAEVINPGADDGHIWVAIHEVSLETETLGQGDVVLVHARDQPAASGGEGFVQGGGQAVVLFVVDGAHARVAASKFVDERAAPVAGGIVDQDEFQFTGRLREDGLDGIPQQRAAIVDRHEHGNEAHAAPPQIKVS
jgi:hypothetical protein